jgi:hypothetical protein
MNRMYGVDKAKTTKGKQKSMNFEPIECRKQ